MRKPVILISIFLSLFAYNRVHAQSDSSGQTKQNKNLKSDTAQKDLVDVFFSIAKRKKNGSDSTAEPKADKYHFSVVPAIGYTLSTGFALIVATNVGFFTNDPDKTNVSSINIPVVYSQYNQLTIPILTNIWTRDNKYNIVTDWRYYKYPQDTYGLGGHSSLNDATELDYSHLRIHQSVLRNIAPNFYAGIGYFLDYHWNIKEIGDTDSSSDAQKYGLPPASVSSGPVINLLFDNRKNSINPQGGLYANILYRPNFTFMGSDENWQSLILDLRSYYKLSADSKNVLAFWSYDWFILRGTPPYLDLPASSWDTYANQGRGYIQSRFRGRQLISLESEYRFGITRDGLFGGVLFVNTQSVSDWPGNKFTVLHPGAGCGSRFKMNKHDDTNVAIDYGFGLQGSQGLFVNLGEVF